jgi:hypothetical protein
MFKSRNTTSGAASVFICRKAAIPSRTSITVASGKMVLSASVNNATSSLSSSAIKMLLNLPDMFFRKLVFLDDTCQIYGKKNLCKDIRIVTRFCVVSWGV